MHRIYAEFAPHRTDDLRPDAKVNVGWTGWWDYLWTCEDDEAFPGEAVYEPSRGEISTDDWFGWAPRRDLKELPAP